MHNVFLLHRVWSIALSFVFIIFDQILFYVKNFKTQLNGKSREVSLCKQGTCEVSTLILRYELLQSENKWCIRLHSETKDDVDLNLVVSLGR